MRLAYQYRLRLTRAQKASFDEWLELCRRQYNYRVAERLNWWERHRCDVNACPLVCHLPELKDRPDFYSQKRDLVNSKALFPEYKDLPSHTLQDVVTRVDKAYERWVKGDSNGKRSGRPRFKGSCRYRSLTFPDPIKPEHIQGKFIQLPKIGKLKAILHRPIPDGCKVKTATISQKADGWYISLSLEDASVPTLTADTPSLDNTIGIDMGLKSFLVTSDGEEVAISQPYRKALEQLKRQQRQLSRKKKGSKRRAKAIKRVAKTHLHVARQRKDFHSKTVQWLLGKGKNVAHEDLNIKGLAKSRLAKSVTDAGWGEFLAILSVKAVSAGQMTIAVNPSGTSQDCSGCGTKVPKTIADRWHSCHVCGAQLDRDHNAARNVQQKAVGHSVSAEGGFVNGQPKNSEAHAVSQSGVGSMSLKSVEGCNERKRRSK